MIFVFDLRCFHSIGRGCPIECYREEGIDADGYDYAEALKYARKEFRRRNYYCENVPDEKIEVLHSDRA